MVTDEQAEAQRGKGTCPSNTASLASVHAFSAQDQNPMRTRGPLASGCLSDCPGPHTDIEEERQGADGHIGVMMADEGGARTLRMLANNQFSLQRSAKLEQQLRSRRPVEHLHFAFPALPSAASTPAPSPQELSQFWVLSLQTRSTLTQAAGAAFRGSPSPCITGPGVDPHPRHLAP